jgi:hypothetical protein
MTQLNQLLAIEKGVQAKTTRTLTDVHRAIQNEGLTSGMTRTYEPRNEDGDELPAESVQVQLTVQQANQQVAGVLARLFDVRAAKDFTNARAGADVEVDGVLLVENAPPPQLLFLEKQLVDLRTYIDKLPTLDPAYVWHEDDSAGGGVYRSDPEVTVRRVETLHNHVRYEATDKHPAQVDVYKTQDPAGDWTVTRFSGAIPRGHKEQMLARVDAVLEAVKFAREKANQIEVVDQQVGAAILGYILS